MALITLNKDEICVILSNFTKFEEISGLIYSCKRMSRIWKDNKEKFDMMFRIKNMDYSVEVWSTIGPKKMEFIMTKTTSKWSHRLDQYGSLYIDGYYNLSLRLEITILPYEIFTKEQITTYRLAVIAFMKDEFEGTKLENWYGPRKYLQLIELRRIDSILYKMGLEPIGKKAYCFQMTMYKEVGPKL